MSRMSLIGCLFLRTNLKGDNMVTRINILRFAVILGLLFVLPGCFSSNPENLKAFTSPELADVTMDEYIIQPPDQITVIASDIPELQGDGASIGQTQTIRPDGKISFEKLGEIHVAGKTPRQVAEVISQLVSSLYKVEGNYPVDVRVSNLGPSTSSKMYYIVGMVTYPGAKPFTGRETTLSAVTKANPNVLAWENKVQIIRPSLDPSQPSKVFCMKFKEMTQQGTNMESNVLLQDGDIIYVPPTILASIGLKIGQLVSPILQGGSATAVLSGGTF